MNCAVAFTHKHQRDRSRGAPARPRKEPRRETCWPGSRCSVRRRWVALGPAGRVEATSIVCASPASVCTRDSRGRGRHCAARPQAVISGAVPRLSRLPLCRYGLRLDRRCLEAPASLNRSIAARAVVVHGGERLEQMALDEGVEPDDVVVVQPPLYARALAAPLFTASVRIAQERRDAAFGQSDRDARQGPRVLRDLR
jgi:hypothetical protein